MITSFGLAFSPCRKRVILCGSIIFFHILALPPTRALRSPPPPTIRMSDGRAAVLGLCRSRQNFFSHWSLWQLGLFFFFYWRRKRKQRREEEEWSFDQSPYWPVNLEITNHLNTLGLKALTSKCVILSHDASVITSGKYSKYFVSNIMS